MQDPDKLFKINDLNIKYRSSPSGLHFFNRSTGINILVDEISLPSNTWSISPRQVSIALTNACDLTCPHCYAPKNPMVLPFDKLTNWLTELDINGCMGVGFGGGEPTLYPRLIELCNFATKKTNLAITMTTHAHRLSNHLLNKLDGNLHFIRVSMDGVGSTYESIRHRSFDALLDRITALKSIARFGINFVINSKTIGDLDAAVQLAKDLGAYEFLLLPEVPVGRGIGIDKDTALALRKWVNRYCGEVPLAISEDGSEGFPICNQLNAENGLSAFVHIDASGFLKRTSYDSSGVHIQMNGVMAALKKLKKITQEVIQ